MRTSVTLFFLSFMLLTLTGVDAWGRVYLQDAATVTGSGQTRAGWTTYWSGACAERTGIDVSYSGRSELKDVITEVRGYAREVIPHVLAHCPTAEIIHVDARGRPASPPIIYRFEMHRSEDWSQSNAVWYSDLIGDSIADGYLPADAAPFRQALVRFQDGRFDAIYDPVFRSHLVGTNIKRHMQEGSIPARISHHTISGYWYELGNDQTNGHCENSREGYPLWGTFTMIIGQGYSTARLTRKFCAAVGEKGHSEDAQLTNPSPSGFERDWGIEWVKFTDLIHPQLVAMDIDAAADAATFARTRKPLYENAELRIYPAHADWCLNTRLEAYYKVPSEERNQTFGGNYASVLGKWTRQVVNEYCGDALSASVANYSEGDETPWDRMSFQFRPLRPSAFGGDEGYLKLTDQHLSDRAKAHLEYLKANHLGPACSGEPFCDLPGGRFLNAIYNGRGDLVQEMDQINRAEVNSMLSGQMAQFNMKDNPITQLFSDLNAADSGLIVDAANKYMYSYAAWGERCLKSGSKTRTFVHTTPPTETINFDGSMDYEPGETYEASYTTNPEFFPLLERVGSYYGAPDSDAPMLNKARRLVLQGLVQMKRHYDCDSPAVARFEQNLITLSEDDLAGQPLSVLPAPTSKPELPAATVSPEVSRTKAPVETPAIVAKSTAPVSTNARAGTTTATTGAPTAPVPPEPPSPTSTPVASVQSPAARPDPPASTMSTAERYAQMNAELRVLSEAFVNEVNAASAAFQAEMGSVSSDAERLEKMKTFQIRMAEMRTEAERETQSIKDKYKL